MKPKDPKVPPELTTKLKFISQLFNKAKMNYSMGSLVSWKDFYVFMGHSEGELEYAWGENYNSLNRKITYEEIKEQEENYKLREELKFITRLLPSQAKLGEPCYYDELIPAQDQEKRCEQSDKDIELYGEENSSIKECESNLEKVERKEKAENIKPPPRYTRIDDGTWKLLYFQSKAIIEGTKKLIEQDKRAILVQSPTGSGKTFIAGGIIEQFWNPALNYFNDCYSPWPVVYVTRSSIVKQTERVMRNKFGFDPVRQCIVINVEQLRAKFGTLMLEEKTVVQKGESHIVWSWREITHPRLFIIDESHLAKNVDSTQSKIIQAISTIKDPKVKVICMSATPFMRVVEAKYLCVNLHKEII